MQELFNKRNRVILLELVKTDFKLRYQGSFLGILWSVLKPLLLFLVMYLVFVKFLKFTDGTKTYPIVLLLGIALWGFFTEATSVGMNAIVSRGDFPKYIIIISSMSSALISLSINLIVVLIFGLISGVDFTWRALLAPLSIIQLFILALGVSLILSTLYVKFRDISHIWDVILQICFYSIPIIYPLSLVSNFHPEVAKVMMLNPIAQSIQDVRYSLIAPQTTPTTWSTINNIWISLIPVVLTVVVVIIGIIYFRKSSKTFAENM